MGDKETTHDEQKLAIEIWKEALGNQRHFNDILLRLRSLCFSYLGVIAALAGFLGKKSEEAPNAPSVLEVLRSHPEWVLAAMAPLLGVYVLDRFYYHGLLLGSVIVGAGLERRHHALLPKMATVLSATSRAMGVTTADAESSVKVTMFYGVSILPFVGLALGWGSAVGGSAVLVIVEVVASWLQKPKLKKAKLLVWSAPEETPAAPAPLSEAPKT